MNQENDIPIVIYEDSNKAVEVRLDADHGTVWLTQAQMAELFDVKLQHITMYLKNFYAEGELDEEGTCKEFLPVQREDEATIRYFRIVRPGPVGRLAPYSHRCLRGQAGEGATMQKMRTTNLDNQMLATDS